MQDYGRRLVIESYLKRSTSFSISSLGKRNLLGLALALGLGLKSFVSYRVKIRKGCGAKQPESVRDSVMVRVKVNVRVNFRPIVRVRVKVRIRRRGAKQPESVRVSIRARVREVKSKG